MDFSTLCDQAGRSGAAVLDNLSQIETAMTDLQREMENLPFFVRAFVASEVKRGTGQDLPAWTQAVSVSTTTVRNTLAIMSRARDAGSLDPANRALVRQAAAKIESDSARLGALVSYMQDAPAKIQAVPGGMLPADRRGELIATVERQTQALRGALAAMPAFAASLNVLSGDAA